MKRKYPISRKANIVIQELSDEVLIYDLIENKAFCLNESSSLIWQMCDGQTSVSEMSIELSKKLNSEADESLIWFALDQLKKENLIECNEPKPLAFEGLSRREIIKKIGISSMAAIPFVASLIAPEAAAANSACMTVNNGCTCGFSPTFYGPGNAFCVPGGIAAMNCASTNCRCRNNGLGADDCVP